MPGTAYAGTPEALAGAMIASGIGVVGRAPKQRYWPVVIKAYETSAEMSKHTRKPTNQQENKQSTNQANTLHAL